jgi:hypothetical protein
MGLFKRGPREEYVTAWAATLIDPMTRVPLQKVLVSLTSHKVTVADDVSYTRPLWVR